VLGINFTSVATIFLLAFGIVLTVGYFFVFYVNIKQYDKACMKEKKVSKEEYRI
jgi:phosphotransferase system  glucose/maltose/N-acetylglucosamine-specific IIC component